MPHIAMFSIGAHGHVNPSLPVIAELVDRGHRVSYAVPEPFAQIAVSAGAAPVVYRSVLPDEEAGEHWPDGGVEAMSIFLDEAEQALPQLRAAFDRDRPAVVLYDIAAYAARALAHSWDIPLVPALPSHGGVGGLCGGHGRGVRRDTGQPRWRGIPVQIRGLARGAGNRAVG